MLRIDDQTIINSIGLDRFMVLKFLRMGLFVFSAFALISIPILFPINMLEQDHLNGLNYLTMGNVIDVNRTWAHCLLAIILFCKFNHVIFLVIYQSDLLTSEKIALTFLVSVIWYTFRETKNYIEMRRKYLLSPAYANTVAARTLYVPSIPKEVNNAEELERIFSKYPGGVRRIWLNRYIEMIFKDIIANKNILMCHFDFLDI